MLDLNKTQRTYYSRGGPCAHCHSPIDPGSECYSDGREFAHITCCRPFDSIGLADPVELVEHRFRQHHTTRAWTQAGEPVVLHSGPLLPGLAAFVRACEKRTSEGFALKWQTSGLDVIPDCFASVWGTDGRGSKVMLIWVREQPKFINPARTETRPAETGRFQTSRPNQSAAPSSGEKITPANECDCGFGTMRYPTESGHGRDCPMQESFLNFLVQDWWDKTPAVGFQGSVKASLPTMGTGVAKLLVDEDPFEGCPGSGPIPGWSRGGKAETPSQAFGISEQELKTRVVANFQPPREPTLLDAMKPEQRNRLQTETDRRDFSPRGSRAPDEVEAKQMMVLRGTFTVQIHGGYSLESRPKPTWKHYTFKIEGPDRDRRFRPDAFIVSLLVGPDNESDYQSFGFIEVSTEPDINGQLVLRVWQSKVGLASAEVRKAAHQLLCDPMSAGELWAMRSKKCFRCGRKLTVPVSLSRGLGPECAERVGL